MLLPFGRTKELETQVDTFLDVIVKGVLVLNEGIKSYLGKNQEDFESRIKMVSDYEHHADDLRRHAETTLYTYSLIPESRGDVLGLLENMDNVIDCAKEVLQQFEVQKPEIPPDYSPQFMELTAKSILAVEHVVNAARCFFREPILVKDHINKINFYESEADRAGLALKKRIFRSDLTLAHKQHLRYFAEQIESLSDIAENVGERLAIAAIKRSI